MVARLLVAIVLAACSSHATKPIEERPQVTPAVPRDAAADAMVIVPGKGDVQLRVEWHDVPVIARASPGRTPCGTARAPAVAPTTTWGVPDAFVALDVAGEAPASVALVVIDHCAATPRTAVTGAHVEVTTTADAPSQLAIAKRGDLADPSSLVAGAPRPIQLPIAGHAVDVALDPGGLYELTGGDSDGAWLVAAGKPFVAVTDGTGVAVLRDVPSGRHAALAWLPARAGQPGRVAHGEATVSNGTLAEVTLDLTQ